jgi:hypothetical protein
MQSVSVEGYIMTRFVPKVKYNLENLEVDAKIIIKFKLQVMRLEYAGWVSWDENEDRQQGVCEYGNEPSVATKGREFVNNRS